MIERKERVCRETDEKIYQPKIHSENIKELYRIGQETGLPITVLVDYAVRGYIKAYEKRKAEQLKAEVEWNIENKSHEQEEPEDQDITDYLEPYQNDPYGENY
jgi:hypothetical protein